MCINKDGIIDNNTTSDDIVRTIYRYMFREGIYKPTRKDIQETLKVFQQKNHQDALVLLIQLVKRQKQTNMIEQTYISDRINDREIGPNYEIKHNGIMKETIHQLFLTPDIKSMVSEMLESLCDRCIDLITSVLNDDECATLFQGLGDYIDENNFIKTCVYLIGQLPDNKRQDVIRNTLNSMENDKYKKLLEVLYHGIKLSIGNNFKNNLKEPSADDDPIGAEIKTLHDNSAERIKDLLIKHGLKLIEYIKRVEGNMSSKQQSLNRHIGFMIINANANTADQSDRPVEPFAPEDSWRPPKVG